MGGTFCFFSTKTEYTEDGVVRFLFLSFSTSQDWPTIGTRIYQRITNACIGNEHLCFLYSSFLFTAITVWKGAVFFLIEAGRMAMACTCTGSEIPLSTFYHDGLDGGVRLFFLQEGKQDRQDVIGI